MPTHASRVSSKKIKTSTSCTSRWSSMRSIHASSSRRLHAISSSSSSSKMFCKADCRSRSTWLRSWAPMLYNVNNPIDSLHISHAGFKIHALDFTLQPRSEITTRLSTHTDTYQNSASCRIRQRTWSFALPRFISSWRASGRRKRNSTIWTKPNGSICTVSTFIPCWWVRDQLSIGFNYASHAEWYLSLILIAIFFFCYIPPWCTQAGRRQRRVFPGPDAERNYRASQQVDGGALLLASHRESLLQRTILYDTCLWQECKFNKAFNNSKEKFKITALE